jgi:hypothetical protein
MQQTNIIFFLYINSALKFYFLLKTRALYKVYNYHDSQACSYKRSENLFWLDGLDENGMVVA